jgi:hypothetical protein
MRHSVKAAAAAVAAAGLAAGGLATAQPGAGGGTDLHASLKVVKQGKQVLALVPVMIDGHGPYTFALDTGASRSLVDSQVAKELGVKQVGSAGKIGGVTGTKQALLVKIKAWRTGTIKLPRTTVVMSNLPFGNASGGIQGLLGSDVLSRFDVITIDYSREQLRLHPRPGS